MWLYISVIPMIFCLAVGLPLLIKSGKLGKVFLWEYLILICPILIWDILTLNAIGSQSLSNVSEVFLLALVIAAYSFFRFKRPNLRTNQKVLSAIILLLLPVALRLFFPSLPE